MSSERVDKLLRRLGEIEESDIESVKQHVSQLIEEKWTDSEILSYCRQTEEVNPHLEEEPACAKMSEIRKKVEERLAKENNVP